MERKIISQRIGRISGDLMRLLNTLGAMENTDMEQYPDNYAMLSTDAALRRRADYLPDTASAV